MAENEDEGFVVVTRNQARAIAQRENAENAKDKARYWREEIERHLERMAEMSPGVIEAETMSKYRAEIARLRAIEDMQDKLYEAGCSAMRSEKVKIKGW